MRAGGSASIARCSPRRNTRPTTAMSRTLWARTATPLDALVMLPGDPLFPGVSGALPGARHVSHERREGRGRQAALRPGA